MNEGKLHYTKKNNTTVQQYRTVALPVALNVSLHRGEVGYWIDIHSGDIQGVSDSFPPVLAAGQLANLPELKTNAGLSSYDG